MHYWGDDWFEKNGNDLNNAIYSIMNIWVKYGRIGTHGKEKYGTFRDHTYFWDGGLHSLLYPGYVWIPSPFLYWKIDPVIKFITKWTGIYSVGLKYQKFIYNYAIQRECKKYPNIVDELIKDLDYPEFIKPGLFGNIDGMSIRNKYWEKA